MEQWTYLALLLLLGSCSCSPRYSLHQQSASFSEASKQCSAVGHLADVRTQQDVDDILASVSPTVPSSGAVEFWIGLKKYKNDCVNSKLPLKGFHWTVDNSTDTAVSSWSINLGTCINTLCGLISVSSGGAAGISWTFAGSTCSTKLPYICRASKPPCVPPAAVRDGLIFRSRTDVSRWDIRCTSGELKVVTCSPADQMWRLSNGSLVNFAHLCLPAQMLPTTTSPTTTTRTASTQALPTTSLDQSDPSPAPSDGRSTTFLALLVVVAVIALLGLLVLLLLLVRCCRRRQSQELTQEKVKEAVTLKSTDDSEA